MRSLALSATTKYSFGDTEISAVAFDLDQNSFYVASEHTGPDADVQVVIFKVEAEEKGNSFEDPSPSTVTMFTTTASSIPSPQVVSLRIIPDTHSLSLIMRGGDISVMSLEDGTSTLEVEGSFDSGILTASWSPDDSLLVIITGDGKLILMTSTFDVLSEALIHTTDFGDDAPINVGWGSKQTQFHGSLGKTAAQAAPMTSVGSSPDDDTLPRISWRGDGAFFVVSNLSPSDGVLSRRILRVYDRQAALQSTSEPVAGLEHTLSWRPSGNLIVGTQRFGFEGGGSGKEDRHDVVFFERNGLRHGEFRIELEAQRKVGGDVARMWGYKVREASWSSDSNILALWIERDAGDIVQLWTTGNYHWYLKQEISAPSSTSQIGRFTSVNWHPEQALQLILTTLSELTVYSCAWETFVSRNKPPNDSGCVAVFDGSSILLTPFRTQNIPPPMSSYQLSVARTNIGQLSRIPIHAAFSPSDDTLAILWESGHVELWNLQARLGPGPGKVLEPSKIWGDTVSAGLSRTHRQVSMGKINNVPMLVVLASGPTGNDILIICNLRDKATREVKLPERNGRLVVSDGHINWQAPNGEIFDADTDGEPIADFPEFCFLSERTDATPELSPIFVGLTNSGKLHVSGTASNKLIAPNVNSFTIATGFIIYTTTAHEAVFVPLASLAALLSSDDQAIENAAPGWEKRRVERGSRIVTVVPSSMSLVLQMPRGNLETINPRPLVMDVVKQDLDAGNYAKAFLSCRKHRIDMNFIVKHDKAAFLDRLVFFVEQVDDVDYINLFLTTVGRGDLSSETIAELCDAIRLELEKKDLNKYINSILTAYVVKTPPDHEAGLTLLLRLRDTNPHLVEDAVKYIIFLVDANRLFDTALGMYDFSLVLMIAQHAQKDPREYLPFLRELRALDKFYQRFRIDDHLKRYEKALVNLSLSGADHFEEAMTYIEQHQLYRHALSVWKDTDGYDSVLNIYGDWLFERREFRQAASVFVEAEKPTKAMIAYEKALEWQELFDLAISDQVPEDDISDMAYRIAEELSSKKRYAEAARVLLDYAQDVREAVITLVQGNCFSEARRIISLNSVPQLMEETVHPGAHESYAQVVEDIGEMREQLRKQISRLQELRIKKVEEPDSFYGVDDPNLHNVDVMTDVSMPATAFTRYTKAPSIASRASKQSSKTKRKMERKVGSGRKGTVDEEEYLLKSLTKLTVRFSTTQGDVGNLLPHLFHFSAEHRAEGLALQEDLEKLEMDLKTALDDVWNKPEDATAPLDSWATRMEEYEKAKKTNPTERVPKPEVSGKDWQIKLFNV